MGNDELSSSESCGCTGGGCRNSIESIDASGRCYGMIMALMMRGYVREREIDRDREKIKADGFIQRCGFFFFLSETCVCFFREFRFESVF